MEDDTKFKLIYMNDEQHAEFKNYIRDSDDKLAAWKDSFAKATEEFNWHTRNGMTHLEKEFQAWSSKIDKRDAAWEKSREKQRKIADAKYDRHAKQVEKFLALIAKRIK